MSKKVKISKICLDIDGEKIELTLKQAQQLKDVLNDTFGEEITQYVYPHHHYPYWSYTANTTANPIPYPGTTITCGDLTATTGAMGNITTTSAADVTAYCANNTLTLGLQ